MPPVRRHGDRCHPALVALEAAELGAALQVPEAQGCVIQAGERVPAIGHHRRRRDRSPVSLEQTELGAACQVPEA
jgi:hypothetical protein